VWLLDEGKDAVEPGLIALARDVARAALQAKSCEDAP
jgi:hypothetical protein